MDFFNPDYQTLNDSNSSDISFETSRIFKTSSPILTIFLTIVALLMSLLTIIGNLLVIFAFIFEKKLHKYSNYFILNLSIADLLIGILIAAYLALNMYSISGTFKDFACTLWLILDYVGGSASVLCIVVISLDRYLLVSKGLKYIASQKVFNAILIIAAVWSKKKILKMIWYLKVNILNKIEFIIKRLLSWIMLQRSFFGKPWVTIQTKIDRIMVARSGFATI